MGTWTVPIQLHFCNYITLKIKYHIITKNNTGQ
jgi:hypothetical protein